MYSHSFRIHILSVRKLEGNVKGRVAVNLPKSVGKGGLRACLKDSVNGLSNGHHVLIRSSDTVWIIR